MKIEAIDLHGVDVLEEGIAPSFVSTMCERVSEPPTGPGCDPKTAGCDTLPG